MKKKLVSILLTSAMVAGMCVSGVSAEEKVTLTYAFSGTGSAAAEYE